MKKPDQGRVARSRASSCPKDRDAGDSKSPERVYLAIFPVKKRGDASRFEGSERAYYAWIGYQICKLLVGAVVALGTLYLLIVAS